MGRNFKKHALIVSVALLCLFAFQNCKFESNGNGGGYTGLQENESFYGAFQPGRTVLLPAIGQPVHGTVTLRNYYFFEKTRACGAANTAQTLASETISFFEEQVIWRSLDCDVEVGNQQIETPMVASYNPWFVLHTGKVFQLLNEPLPANKTPYTLALCRQITWSNDGVDYGWDVIMQDRGGLLEATIIRGRQDPLSGVNVRSIWGPLPFSFGASPAPLSFVGNDFNLTVAVPNPANHTETTGKLQAVLDGSVVRLDLSCWLQNQ